MAIKRFLIEAFVGTAGRFVPVAKSRPESPGAIFVLRNNDIGDLIVITPIFDALRRRFPEAQIIAGVGKWNLPVLEGNPFVDQILEINAPWHNKFMGGPPSRSLGGLRRSLAYILRSPEVERLRSLRCGIGIDILGSPEGSLLLGRARIPWRMGVKGYAGGQSACQQCVLFDPQVSVGRAALKFAELLGVEKLPASRPQLYLTPAELARANQTWTEVTLARSGVRRRITVAPGGGFAEKCWPPEFYRDLVRHLAQQSNADLLIVGGQGELALGDLVKGGQRSANNYCGKSTLRETFALIATSDGVICNSSMALHVAAAFARPTLVLLGAAFPSAEQHKRLWGHGPQDLHLGRDEDRASIVNPGEVLPIAFAHLDLLSA